MWDLVIIFDFKKLVLDFKKRIIKGINFGFWNEKNKSNCRKKKKILYNLRYAPYLLHCFFLSSIFDLNFD